MAELTRISDDLSCAESVSELMDTVLSGLEEKWGWRRMEGKKLAWVFFRRDWADGGARVFYCVTASLDTRLFILHHSGGDSGTWAGRLREGDPATTMSFDLLLMCAADGSFRQPRLDDDTPGVLRRWLTRVAKRNPPNGVPREHAR